MYVVCLLSKTPKVTHTRRPFFVVLLLHTGQARM
jgi:hypothetical protein